MERNAGPWTHADGTPCPATYPSDPTPGLSWWCAEHQQYVHARPIVAADDYLGPKPMPRPETFARNIGPGAVPTEDLGGLYESRPVPVTAENTLEADADDLGPAERLGLAVGAAYGAALADRDQARDMAVALEGQLAEAIRLLDLAVHHWPETTWAADSKALEDLVQGIENLKAVESPENPQTPKVDR